MPYDRKQNIYSLIGDWRKQKLSTTYVVPEGPDRGKPYDLSVEPTRIPNHDRPKSPWKLFFEEVGMNIRNRRKSEGWTPAKLAETAGISEETLKNVENGEECSIKTLFRIAGALRLDIVIPGIPVYHSVRRN
jgi:DNA-binding XRE family transcriptional regulator